MYINKWIKGRPINSVRKAINLIMNKKVIFHHHKPQTYGWTQNWSLKSIEIYVSTRQLFTAKENKVCLK